MPFPWQVESDSTDSGASNVQFTRIYDDHVAFVWRALFRFGVARADLDDCAQEVFVVVHKKLAHLDGSHPRAWLAAIARRVAADYRRGAARRGEGRRAVTQATHEPSMESSSEANQDEQLTAASTLQHLLSHLDDDSRELFVLAELEDLDIADAARVLGMNPNTAYSKLRTARARLRADYSRLLAQDKWRSR